MVSPEPNAGIKLLPSTVNIQGNSPVVMENQKGHWGNPHDSASCLVDLQKPGRFDVRIEYACDKNMGGSTFLVKVADREFEMVSEDTGAWRTYRIFTVGQVEFAAAGRQGVTVTPSPKTPWKAISLKSVTLAPVP